MWARFCAGGGVEIFEMKGDDAREGEPIFIGTVTIGLLRSIMFT